MDDSQRTSRHGRMVVICGCMFSGKSERLVARVEAARNAGLGVVAFKHALDNRYGTDRIVTHSGTCVAATAITRSAELLDGERDADLIAIDEAQFFDGGIVEVVGALRRRGCCVVISGLDLDSWGLPFGPMPELMAMADEVIRTQSVCSRCGAVADHTQRLSAVGARTMVGGAESYEPRCGKCFAAPPMELRC